MVKSQTYRGEADVKKEVKKLLTKHGWFWWCPPANGFGKAGTSDFHALRGGVFMAVETKFGSNRPTVLQRAFLQSIAAESAMAFVVDEVSVRDLRTWLAAFDCATAAVSKNEQVSAEDGAAMLDAVARLTEKML